MPTKPTFMSNGEGMTKKRLYELVDEFIFGLQKGEYQALIEWEDRHMGAVKLMEDLELFVYSKPSDRLTSICEITLEGLDVVEAGGVESYLKNKKL